MDVVNGKIVSARTERSRSDIWSALKPSCASVNIEGSSSLSPPWGVTHGNHGATPTMAMEPVAVRWHRWSRDNNNIILGQPHKQFPSARFGAGGSAAVVDHQAGWKRSSTARDHYHNNRPCTSPGTSSASVALFDEEMAIHESRFFRAVRGRLVGQDSLSTCVTADVEGLEITQYSGPTNAPKSQGVEGLEMCIGTNSPKRRRMELSGIDQDGVTWIAPLRSLLCKELTVSDVGDLGRIVLPKKDAEGQLPQIDSKGKLLEMQEYSFSKQWFFQYKWWINNKSRMYVLENTGEFIKYHGLKAHDSFVVYEDGCGNLVARGQKK